MCSCCGKCGARCASHYKNGDRQSCPSSCISSTPNPVTAPDMVELGAAALWDRAEPVQKRARPNWAAVKDDPDWYRGVRETRADARAVLAAISEAGAVEWGVRLSDGSVEEHDTRISADDTCLDYPSTEAVVSRLTFPWERAE